MLGEYIMSITWKIKRSALQPRNSGQKKSLSVTFEQFNWHILWYNFFESLLWKCDGSIFLSFSRKRDFEKK